MLFSVFALYQLDSNENYLLCLFHKHPEISLASLSRQNALVLSQYDNMLLGLLVKLNNCFLVCNQNLSICPEESPCIRLTDYLGRREITGYHSLLFLAFGVAKNLHQKSFKSCLQMFFFSERFCKSLWAMNRLGVCHDNQLPITKAVRLSKAIKWWNNIVCCRISQCVSASYTYVGEHSKLFLCGV